MNEFNAKSHSSARPHGYAAEVIVDCPEAMDAASCMLNSKVAVALREIIADGMWHTVKLTTNEEQYFGFGLERTRLTARIDVGTVEHPVIQMPKLVYVPDRPSLLRRIGRALRRWF